MHIKQTKMICSVQGCRNTDTVFASRNGVCVNTPNICRECIKNIYEAVFDVVETPNASTSESVQNADVNVQNADVASGCAVEVSAGVRESGANAVISGKSQPKPSAKSRSKGR